MKSSAVYTGTTLRVIEERFENQLRSVEELVSFDRTILDLCVSHLEGLNEKLKKGPFGITNPTYLAENTLKAIRNVRENDSLRVHYLSMFNSCLVLQVSYFTSAIADVFKYSCASLNSRGDREDLNEDILKQKNDINFQNMHSIIRTFKKYLNVEINKDNLCNTIILALSSRHAIVHSMGRVDDKFLTQIDNAVPRDIKHEFSFNDKIQFSQSELEFVRLAMLQFLCNLKDQIRQVYRLS
jgi:hypothetical protein